MTGTVYFASGTAYYIDNAGCAKFNSLDTTGATNLGSTLGVTGATTLSSTLAVTGATTLSSTLAVTGTATMYHVIPADDNTTYELGSATARWKKLHIGTADTYGGATQPIWWSDGKPAECTSYANAVVKSAGEFTSEQSITLTGDVTGTASSKAGWSIAATAWKLTPHEHDATYVAAATAPTDYNGKLIFTGMKTNTTLGITSELTYSYVIGLRGYDNKDGGGSHEFAFNDNAIYHRMSSTGADAWDSWNMLVRSAAGSATGSATQPVWINSAGIITACTSYANASVNYANSAGAVAWANVSDKPATATRWPTWDEVTGKPSTFTPASHTHDYLPLSGGTLSGDLGLKTSTADSPDIVWWYGDTNNEQARIWMGSGGTTKFAPNYRCYASDGTSLYSGKLVIGDGTGASGTWGISITGNAATVSRATFGDSGNGTHDANAMTSNGLYYYTSNGPATSLGASTTDGAMYVQAYNTTWVAQIAQDYRNGGLYVRGKNNGTWQSWFGIPKMSMESYPSLLPPTGANNWIKVGTSNTSYGLLPSQGGSAGSGHNYLGTSTWYWKYAYVDEIYGHLNGNCTGSSASCTGNAATATKLSNTPNNTTTFLRGDNTWSNTLGGAFQANGTITANGGYLKTTANGNTVTIGSQNSSWCHIYNSANIPFIFNHGIQTTDIAGTLGSTTYPFHALFLGGATNATMTSASANPRIIFSEAQGTQPVLLVYTDYDSYRSPAGLKVIGGTSATPAWFEVEGHIYASAVHSAVWNDYAECRKSDINEPGRVVTPDDSGMSFETTERLMPGCRIISDTWGMLIGESEEAKTPVAICGRVLAYPYQAIENYHAGDCVCSAPNGTVDIMTRDEIKEWPDRIIGVVNEIPDYEIWTQTEPDGEKRTKQIAVNGRIWIDVK